MPARSCSRPSHAPLHPLGAGDGAAPRSGPDGVRTARIEVGEVAFLRITGVTHFGAFADWGLPKDLLVPLAEQTSPLQVGARAAIGLVLDDRGRATGTQRVRELLATPRDLSQNDWVEGEVWRDERGVGLFVILRRRYLARVPATEPHRLQPGDAARFRVVSIHPDGKVDLSLRGPSVNEMETDAAAVLAVLSRTPPLRVGDASSPEEIRTHFGLSKKAFKRAVGRLLKQGAVRIGDDGTVQPVSR